MFWLGLLLGSLATWLLAGLILLPKLDRLRLDAGDRYNEAAELRIELASVKQDADEVRAELLRTKEAMVTERRIARAARVELESVANKLKAI